METPVVKSNASHGIKKKKTRTKVGITYDLKYASNEMRVDVCINI